ncbi:gluconokinase [Agromyces sp. MMS24-K17]|uniref:gluconokinase n=1 Tax=Agromyces sp. MMS24-K17 TaxID=3372850 RepID=UPI003754C67B
MSTEAMAGAAGAAGAAPAARLEVPLIVMGVSGSGKSTIGAALAAAFGVPFHDADDLHPAANKAKMAAGHPLDDDDRGPWLATVAALIGDELAAGRPVVVACSALKRRYRDRLVADAPGTVFVHLAGGRDLIADRQAGRTHEYMPASLLDSQFEAFEPLEPDERGIVVDIGLRPEALVDDVRHRLAPPVAHR